MTGYASKRAMSKSRSIEEEMLERAGNAMAKDIDTEVLMSAIGWHKLELSEGTVYGAKYLTVHPNNGWHWNEMMDWTVKTFGPSAADGVWTPDMRWYANNAKFWFRDEKDLNWFVLRWS
jgi:hypothetical protein